MCKGLIFRPLKKKECHKESIYSVEVILQARNDPLLLECEDLSIHPVVNTDIQNKECTSISHM